MSNTYDIVVFITNFLLYIFMLLAVHLNCTRRFSTWLTIVLGIVSFAGYAVSSFLPFLSLIRPIYGWLYVVLVVQLLYRDKWYFKLIAASASVMAMLLADVLYEAMMPRTAAATSELMMQHPIPVYSVFLFIDLVVQSINVVFVRLLGKRNSFFRNKWQVLLALAFPINQFISLWMFFSTYADLDKEYHSWQLLTTILMYLLADAALIVLFKLVEKNAKIQAKNDMLEDEISIQSGYYEKLGSSYDQIRKMRHDIDNHLYTIQALISSGKADEAAEHAREISKDYSSKPLFISCENIVAASFLGKKKEDFEQNGVNLEMEISLPGETGISNSDLICVFGNILDNALESSKGLKNAHVEMKVNYQEPYLSIRCNNPVGENSRKHNRRIPEMERGLGMMILNEMARKYDGDLQAEQTGDLFQTQLVLKGDTQNA